MEAKLARQVDDGAAAQRSPPLMSLVKSIDNLCSRSDKICLLSELVLAEEKGTGKNPLTLFSRLSLR